MKIIALGGCCSKSQQNYENAKIRAIKDREKNYKGNLKQNKVKEKNSNIKISGKSMQIFLGRFSAKKKNS